MLPYYATKNYTNGSNGFLTAPGDFDSNIEKIAVINTGCPLDNAPNVAVG